MKTRMEPNSSFRLQAQSDAAANAGSLVDEVLQSVPPIPCPDEPNLFCLPEDVKPYYRPLPIVARVAVWILAAALSALSTWKQRLTWLAPIVAIRNGNWSWKKLLWFTIKTAAIAIGSNAVLQDIVLPPSRLSSQMLKSNYFLPSKLSRYEPLNLPETSSDPLGVHWLEYQQPQPSSADKDKNYNFQSIFVNHGFGASSLSWLPALPVLVQRLNAKVGLGHDAVGFGFTDRPSGKLTAYTSAASSHIGCELLTKHISDDSTPSSTIRPVLLLGHSMGALTTLKMALKMNSNVPKRIVLVAPALGMSRVKASTAANTETLQKESLFEFPQMLTDVPAAYILRRVVGFRNFWRYGLGKAWGDPARLSDSDILRFQWPGVARGWERGLLRFARAQSEASDMSDAELLQRVLNLPNTQIHCIAGSKDRIVPPTQLRKFFAPFPQIQITEMPGLGHDPFEEDVESFVQNVENLLHEDLSGTC
jgi:pimeloyl-ACP methyl ester carboxylesterase